MEFVAWLAKTEAKLIIRIDEWAFRGKKPLTLNIDLKDHKEETFYMTKILCSEGKYKNIRKVKTGHYIDKTLLIDKLNPGGPYLPRLVITAPRRWGKSTNLTMLELYYSFKTSKEEFL